MVLLLSALLLASGAHANPSGDQLAQQVVAATGDVYGVSSIRFSFVVEAGGVEKVRRTHEWHRKTGTVTVTQGADPLTFTGLHTLDPSSAVFDPPAHAAVWAEVAQGVDPQAAAAAWATWINDSYWLLAPGKLLDEGVARSVDDSGRLGLNFQGVGVTPGDRYLLTIDPTTQRIAAWEFTLESGRTGHFLWMDYAAVGPLTLSMRRATEAGDFVIRFEDVTVEP